MPHDTLNSCMSGRSYAPGGLVLATRCRYHQRSPEPLVRAVDVYYASREHRVHSGVIAVVDRAEQVPDGRILSIDLADLELHLLVQAQRRRPPPCCHKCIRRSHRG